MRALPAMAAGQAQQALLGAGEGADVGFDGVPVD
jgi:hypothetical protein